MKRSVVIFGLAFLNVMLLAIVVWQGRLLHQQATELSAPSPFEINSGPAVPSSSSSPNENQAMSPTDHNAGQKNKSSHRDILTGSATNRLKFDWRQVESADYRTYVKNLRDIGCPEQTVQDLVVADVRQAFAARRAEVMAERYRDFKFWKADTEENGVREELEKKRRAVDEEMEGAVRELLGTEVIPRPTTADWQQAAIAQQLSFLPDDKREKTQELLLRYADTDAQIKDLAWGHGVPENPEERLRLLETYDRKRTEMHALLTPEEYEQVELTASWTADNLRRAMAKFQPTETEFREIFRTWRAHDENLARLFGNGQPDPGNEQVFAKIKEFLGEERYNQYWISWWQ